MCIMALKLAGALCFDPAYTGKSDHGVCMQSLLLPAVQHILW